MARLIGGFILGSATGVILGIWLFRSNKLRVLLLPGLQALRSVPPVATIPFFLIWFGFSEVGKVFLLVFGVGINLAFASYQILAEMPDKYIYALRSLHVDINRLPWPTGVPLVLERLLPTLRFSLSTSLSLVVVAELLGSQLGLGYLIQSAQSTFSMHTVMLCVIILGVLNGMADFFLIKLWQRIVFWRAS